MKNCRGMLNRATCYMHAPISYALTLTMLLTFASDVKGAKPRIYQPQSAACYVQLKPSWADKPLTAAVRGSDQPVCRAVLRNMNKLCNQPISQRRPVLHPSTTDITLPEWQQLNVANNSDLVREAYTATANTTELKAAYWSDISSKVHTWIDEGRILLKTAEIRLHDKSPIYSAYLVENARTSDIEMDSVTELPILFLADHGRRTPARYSPGFGAYGILWKFNGLWYLVGTQVGIRFGPNDIRPALTIAHINDSEHLSQVIECTIMNLNVYKNRK